MSTLLSDTDDDSPMPSTRVVGRINPQALARAAAQPQPRPRPLSQLSNGTSQRLTKEELLARAGHIDRMATKLRAPAQAPAIAGRRAGAPVKPSPLVMSTPANPPATRHEAGIFEDEQPAAPAAPTSSDAVNGEADVDLGLGEHLASLAQIATVPESGSDERAAALAAAMSAAVSSLTACEQQQIRTLREGVDELKSEFRSRLEALEAEFVQRAEALSAELAGAVAECKRESMDVVSSRAEELGATILAIARTEDPPAPRPRMLPASIRQGHYAMPTPRVQAVEESPYEEEDYGADPTSANVAGARFEARLEAGIDDWNGHGSVARQVADARRSLSGAVPPTTAAQALLKARGNRRAGGWDRTLDSDSD